MNTDRLVGNVVEEWLKKGEDLPTLVCCVDKAHTVHVCEEFNGRGIPAEYVIDDTPQDERDEIFARTERGQNKVIVKSRKHQYRHFIASCSDGIFIIATREDAELMQNFYENRIAAEQCHTRHLRQLRETNDL